MAKTAVFRWISSSQMVIITPYCWEKGMSDDRVMCVHAYECHCLHFLRTSSILGLAQSWTIIYQGTPLLGSYKVGHFDRDWAPPMRSLQKPTTHQQKEPCCGDSPDERPFLQSWWRHWQLSWSQVIHHGGEFEDEVLWSSQCAHTSGSVCRLWPRSL